MNKNVMTKQEIKNEMARWVDSGFKQVWCNTSENGWITVLIPSWTPALKWIVDDKYAELRKAFYDGKTIQNNYRDPDIWIDVDEPLWVIPACNYRIKPEPVFEWQWIIESFDKDEGYFMTEGFYTEDEKEREDWIKFEPSKRIRQ